MASLEEMEVALGEWWCPKCSVTHSRILVRDASAPDCPRCGTELEPAGTGDDGPYPEDEE